MGPKVFQHPKPPKPGNGRDRSGTIHTSHSVQAPERGVSAEWYADSGWTEQGSVDQRCYVEVTTTHAIIAEQLKLGTSAMHTLHKVSKLRLNALEGALVLCRAIRTPYPKAHSYSPCPAPPL